MVWKEYFEELLNVEFDWKKENLEQVCEVSGVCVWRLHLRSEGGNTKAKLEKAPGSSGVEAEMLKAAGGVGIQWITDLCNATNAVVTEEKIPEDCWRKSWMISNSTGNA